MSSGLILNIGSYTLNITAFERGPYPRRLLQWTSISQSARGSTIRRNTEYFPKHIWEINCKLDIAEWRTLSLMFAYFWQNKGNFTIDDYTEPFFEEGSRTRALASGASTTTQGSGIYYFAQYNAEPSAYPELTELNTTSDLVSFVMIETTPTSA